MTESAANLDPPGHPKIHGYYEQVLEDFSIDDVTHTLHYLLKMLDNMQRLDDAATEAIGEGTE